MPTPHIDSDQIEHITRDVIPCAEEYAQAHPPNPHDKRSSLVSLTSFALKKLPGPKKVLLDGNKEALQGFTDREIATLSRLLLRVVKNLDPDTTGLPS